MDATSAAIEISAESVAVRLQLIPFRRRAHSIDELFSLLLPSHFRGDDDGTPMTTSESSFVDLKERLRTEQGPALKLALMAAMAKPRALNPLKPLSAEALLPFSLSKSLLFMPRASPRCESLHNGTGSASLLPVIKAQSSPDYIPDSKFYKVEAILRPWRVSHVSSGLMKMGIRGVTVSDVRGFGAQGGSMERQAGSEFSEDMYLAKVKMEVVVCKDQVEAVIDKIIEEARTGEIGDGKIFVIPVSDVIRVRTGERGEKAERMMGGRADIMSSATSN